MVVPLPFHFMIANTFLLWQQNQVVNTTVFALPFQAFQLMIVLVFRFGAKCLFNNISNRGIHFCNCLISFSAFINHSLPKLHAVFEDNLKFNVMATHAGLSILFPCSPNKIRLQVFKFLAEISLSLGALTQTQCRLPFGFFQARVLDVQPTFSLQLVF